MNGFPTGIASFGTSALDWPPIVPVYPKPIKHIYSTLSTRCALYMDTSLFCWPDFKFETASDFYPTSTDWPQDDGYYMLATTMYCFAGMKSDTTTTVWGTVTGAGTCIDNPPLGKGWVSISWSQQAFAALRNDGSIHAWGKEEYGGLNGYTSCQNVDVPNAMWPCKPNAYASASPRGLTFTHIHGSDMTFCALGYLLLATYHCYTTHYSLLTTHYSLLTTHYSLLTTHYSLLTTHYSLLTTHYSLLTTHYSLLTTHYSLLTTHYSLLTTHYPLPTTHVPRSTYYLLLTTFHFPLSTYYLPLTTYYLPLST